jgi:GTPase SAR1 family protein
VAVKEIRLQHQGKIFVAVASIWDIMGNEAFRDLMKDSFFSQAHGVLAVCDASRPSTLGGLDEWHKCVEEVSGRVPFHVLLNKADLTSEGDLKEADVRAFCTARGWSCSSASAKTGAGVWEAFQRLAKSALEEARKVATVVSQ